MRPVLGQVPHLRTPVVAAAAAVVVLAGAALFGLTRAPAVLPAAAAVAVVVVALAGPGGCRSALVVAGFAVLSTAWTATLIGAGRRAGDDLASGLSTFAETLAVLLALVLVVAYGPPRWAAGTAVLCLVAVAGTVLRFAEPTWTPVTAVGSAGWGMLVLGAAAVGLYLRWRDGLQAQAQARAVQDARRAHRLQVAADLHDYVAHDVSEMLALAQAGQIVNCRDPRQAEGVFRAIERAALHSMHSLDRTVRMLGDLSGERAGGPGLADLDELVGRFGRPDGATVELTVDPGLAGLVGEESSGLAYRVVTEALTNVRRHAPCAVHVRVLARRDGDVLRLSIVDDGGGGAPGDRRSSSGLGLAGLRERVTALHGALTAGPREPAGWQVSVTLPLSPGRGPARA